MAVLLKDAVPWGRSYQEYVDMFALSGDDLNRGILGCGDGPAAFNTGMRQRGKWMVSTDPVYAFSAHGIESRIRDTFDSVIEQTRVNQDRFVWRAIPSLEALGNIRMAAMGDFLSGYNDGASTGSYVASALPDLPFREAAFDLGLCSHLLFLYDHLYGLDFHVAALLELRRVAREVRVFPLLNMEGRPSPLLEPVLDALERAGCGLAIKQVDYEFQRGGDKMLVIT